jgi:KipI family sensor histidine kinase inhibitor
MIKVPPLKLSWLGEAAILCDTDAPELDVDLQERFWALGETLASSDYVVETVPGMNNLLVMIDPSIVSGAAALSDIEAAWKSAQGRKLRGKQVEILVRYGGDKGVDLPHVCEATGLTAQAYVELHSAAEYVVFAVGSQPGFGYLGGLDERLAVPRRAVPRLKVESGSVVIGGAQAGVISKTSPSGWHIIGTTSQDFFDPTRSSPSLLAAGDIVRFRVESLET